MDTVPRKSISNNKNNVRKKKENRGSNRQNIFEMYSSQTVIDFYYFIKSIGHPFHQNLTFQIL